MFTIIKKSELKKTKSKTNMGGEAISPWSYVLQQIECANGDEYTPSHLEKDGMSLLKKKLNMNGC